jgi:small ligand-binding sensory domain FIST
VKWTSTCTTHADLEGAVEQAAAQVFEGLGRREPDLLVAFVHADHAKGFAALGGLLSREFEGALVFGCSADGVIGGGREREEGPALALTAAVLPGVKLQGTHLEADDVPPIYAERRLWEETLKVNARDEPVFLMLADPFSFATDGLLKGLDRAFPASTKIGGLTSGGRQPGSTALYLGDRVYRSGMVLLAMSGDIEMKAALAHGSRPIGEPMFATGVHDNLIRELDGKVPREVLGAVFESLPPADRKLFGEALHLGIGAARGRNEYGSGDFLIRSILGLDPKSGALWIGDRVEANAVVQLHVRDALAASLDIERSLALHRQSNLPGGPAAALLFSCVSRGTAFYGHPDHDSNAYRRLVADVPIGGFFCGGEFGPLGGTTYLHGHTSVFGTIGPRGSLRQSTGVQTS